jgi:hypothetical protein
MNLKYVGKWDSTESLEYFDRLNNISSDNFFAYRGPYSEKFVGCVQYIGGRTDRYFFDKKTIDKLSVEDQEEFVAFLKQTK